MADPQIRWLVRRDVEEVARIDFECYPQPWCVNEILECLKQRNVIGMVFEVGKDIAGYMIYELHKSRLVVVRFVVHPNWQRNGVGRRMVQRLLDKLSTQRRRHIEFYVSERSMDAHRFLKAMTFTAVGVERNYIGDGHDAYLFRYTLPVNADIPKWVSRIS
jgi:ribosomal-protein-alanine N-acetyltransferase